MIIVKVTQFTDVLTPVIYFLALLLSQRRPPYDAAPDTMRTMQTY
jgi:hypothetical protein